MGSLPPAVLIMVVAALSALAGAVLTWLIIYLTRDRRPERRDSGSADAGASSGDLMRVVASKSGPTILIKGQRRHHLREIRDRKTGEETVAAVRAVLAFAEGWLPSLQAEGDKPQPVTTPDPVRPAVVEPPPQERAAVARPASSRSSADPMRLVEEIDRLLQKRLTEHPEFAQERIRLTRDVNGRLLIYVGQNRYRSTGDIPNDNVAEFVRETIRIWERR